MKLHSKTIDYSDLNFEAIHKEMMADETPKEPRLMSKWKEETRA